MKTLTCSACGGNELIEQEGMYVCQFCGTKFVKEKSDVDNELRAASLDKDPRIADMLKRADIYWRHGNQAQAKALYRQILELDSRCEIARQRV